ncbi:MAG TPA: ATP-binding protein [Candidatus Acidoferrales bacterium]|nr:ATP-binding protein [Candidatus Acidoferrales bacterium]
MSARFNDSLRVRLGAAVLALATLAAIVFGIINFQQRTLFTAPDDGVSWIDNPSGVVAWHVTPKSPAAIAGLRAGDQVLAVNDVPIHGPIDVTKRLWRIGLWSIAHYQIVRGGKQFEVQIVVQPTARPSSIENYLSVVGVLYLFIGLFIFARRWNATRAVHFYIFCLVSFVLYSFQYTGKLTTFDWEIYWAGIVARLLQPALLLHFAMVFPERRPADKSRGVILGAIYGVPGILLAVRVLVGLRELGFMPSVEARNTLDRLDLACLGIYFLLAALVFVMSYRRASSGILRQQLKWVTGGALAGILPFLLLYIVPFFLGVVPGPWMNLSTVSLVLIPLSFGYAIIRYRLMDVDIIFKRGLAYTAASGGVVAVYIAIVALIGALFHTAWPSGTMGGVIAIVVAAFLFQPFRDYIQARLDRFFYRDRLDYRRTLIEFGRTLTSEVRLDPMLASVMDRISQALLVDRLAIFIEDEAHPGSYRIARSIGVRYSGALDMSFLDEEVRPFAQGILFYESARAARESSPSVRYTLEQLDLNYFIPCQIRDHAIAVLGLGKTVDGDFLSSEDVELLHTIAGYLAIALDNAQLYNSLEQKAAQIERLKDFSENIVESMNVGVLAVDFSGAVESWNTQLEGLVGVPRQEAVGRKLEEVLPAELMSEIEVRSTDERVSSLYKFPMRSRDGRNLVVNVSMAPLVGKSGNRIGRLILFDDVTQRMHMEEQVFQNEKLTSLGLLAAGVAHEVNTPLAVISNYIQMLAKQLPAGDPRQQLIEKVVKQTFRASEIVNNLLNFSRTGAAEFTEVNLNSVVEEVLTLVAHPFRTGQVQVTRNLQQELPAVLGSNNKLQQVFLNLFLNARDAMPSGGMVEIRTAAHNGSVEVEIIDSGSGISREDLNRIFDPFFTTKSSGRGTGLGLSVSYGIVKEHAGKVDVRSTPGKGTSFRLEFPVARKAVHV